MVCGWIERKLQEITRYAKYSPVAEASTIRTVFALAAINGQRVLQADFPNAYLSAVLNEKIYVIQPKGLEDPESRTIYAS